MNPSENTIRQAAALKAQGRTPEAIELLRQRLDGLAARRANVMPLYEAPADPAHLHELLGWWVHSADAAMRWARGLIERLEAGDYVMADER